MLFKTHLVIELFKALINWAQNNIQWNSVINYISGEAWNTLVIFFLKTKNKITIFILLLADSLMILLSLIVNRIGLQFFSVHRIFRLVCVVSRNHDSANGVSWRLQVDKNLVILIKLNCTMALFLVSFLGNQNVLVLTIIISSCQAKVGLVPDFYWSTL